MVHFNVAAYRHKVCLRKIVHLRACFSRRWNPADSKAEYLKTFSLESWNSLSVASKQKHSLQSCTACDCNYSLQIAHIPIRSKSLKRKSLKNNSQQVTPTSSKKSLAGESLQSSILYVSRRFGWIFLVFL